MIEDDYEAPAAIPEVQEATDSSGEENDDPFADFTTPRPFETSAEDADHQSLPGVDLVGAEEIQRQMRPVPNVIEGSAISSSDQRYNQLRTDMIESATGVADEMKRLGLTEEFAKLQPGKGGAYSEEQLAYLKEHSKQAFVQAQNFNAALQEATLMKAKAQLGGKVTRTAGPAENAPLEEARPRTAPVRR